MSAWVRVLVTEGDRDKVAVDVGVGKPSEGDGDVSARIGKVAQAVRRKRKMTISNFFKFVPSAELPMKIYVLQISG